MVVCHTALFYWHLSVGELGVNPIENQSSLPEGGRIIMVFIGGGFGGYW